MLELLLLTREMEKMNDSYHLIQIKRDCHMSCTLYLTYGNLFFKIILLQEIEGYNQDYFELLLQESPQKVRYRHFCHLQVPCL